MFMQYSINIGDIIYLNVGRISLKRLMRNSGCFWRVDLGVRERFAFQYVTCTTDFFNVHLLPFKFFKITKWDLSSNSDTYN